MISDRILSQDRQLFLYELYSCYDNIKHSETYAYNKLYKMLLLRCCTPETNYIHFANKYENKAFAFRIIYNGFSRYTLHSNFSIMI